LSNSSVELSCTSTASRSLTPVAGWFDWITALSIDMSSPAMPQLQTIFKVDVAVAQLTLSLFVHGFAVGQLLCGPLSDKWGRQPVLITEIAVFTVAGLICALSTSLTMLVFDHTSVKRAAVLEAEAQSVVLE
jgi:DHA1 family bicyclomycin/chloramphenicol resistance-like MFS transporter